MKIGVVPQTSSASGGVYQYSLSIVDALARTRPKETTLLVPWPPDDADAPWLRRGALSVKPLYPLTVRHHLGRVARFALGDARAERLRYLGPTLPRPSTRTGQRARTREIEDRPAVRRWLRKLGVDFMIYPSPNALAFEAGVPYVMAVHDLQHRLQPEFPEVSADGEWERREYLFRNGVRAALAILVDSDVGREDLLSMYGEEIEPSRVEVLPFVSAPYLKRASPASVSEARTAFRLPARFLLFPAQFWPHKNHRRVIDALDLLRRAGGPAVSLVLTGSAITPIMTRELTDIQVAIRSAGLEDQVTFTGRVPDSAMAAIYSAADGVVLPTFFGPTNIPVVEAWALDLPVLTSDIRGIREQCADAAILVDPRSISSIADGLNTLWTDTALRARLITAGRHQIARYGVDDFARRLDEILHRVEERLTTNQSQSSGATG